MTVGEIISYGKEMLAHFNAQENPDDRAIEFIEQSLKAIYYMQFHENVSQREDCKSMADIENLITTKFPMITGLLESIRKLPPVQPAPIYVSVPEGSHVEPDFRGGWKVTGYQPAGLPSGVRPIPPHGGSGMQDS